MIEQKIAEIQITCPESGLQLCSPEHPATSDLCRECERNRILALIALEQQPLVDLLAEAQFEIAFDQKNGYPSYTVKETLSKIDTALKGGQQ